MNEQEWNDFRISEIAVHCDTEEKAKDFIKECFKRNITWVGEQVFNTRWHEYKERTSYSCYAEDSRFVFAPVDFHVELGFKIIKWELGGM